MSPPIVLRNLAHAGDIVLTRSVIVEIIKANPSRSFLLQCRQRYAYLWSDLPAELAPAPDHDVPINTPYPVINLWFAFYGDMLTNGLTYRSSVETYNRQAQPLGLAVLPYADNPVFVRLPRPAIGDVLAPSVLVENGPVLSGQPVLDIDPFVNRLAELFAGTAFYCSGPIHQATRANVISVADWNLKQLSVLSEHTNCMIARLSAVMVASFTEHNHGRPRIVWGKPLGCPIWDEVGVQYTSDLDFLVSFVRSHVS